eukprot:5056143-Amphidinium_carterae.2
MPLTSAPYKPTLKRDLTILAFTCTGSPNARVQDMGTKRADPFLLHWIPPCRPLSINTQITSGDLHWRKPAVPPNLHEFAFGHRPIAEHSGLDSIHTHLDVTQGLENLPIRKAKVPRKVSSTADENHIINILSDLNLSARTSERLDEASVQKINSMPTTKRETTRGCDSLTNCD